MSNSICEDGVDASMVGDYLLSDGFSACRMSLHCATLFVGKFTPKVLAQIGAEALHIVCTHGRIRN